jgi:cellulose synthase/poly-beta-1,6-N-acetylglucosamine synthase-like glycosyltransferase
VTVFAEALRVIAVAALVYFAVLNLISIGFTAVAWREITRHLRSRRNNLDDELLASPLAPGISILLPAYNEAAGVVESVRSLLALRYPRHEVVVVNDGSKDATLDMLSEAFELMPVRRALRDGIPTKEIRGVYVSRRHPSLIVVDKDNGGKADALNAGVNAAEYPYVCAIDADALVEEGALLQVARPVLDDPELVAATGGIVRIVNGCRVDHGRVVQVRLPRSRLATLQVVEYFRAFLVGRVGWSRANALMIISGAFGLFNRGLVETVGGYWSATVGEDVELVLRLHRHLRERGVPYRIDFVPDPVCWTEAPEDLRTLSRQRRRWHRGLGQALWRHRRAIGNPRYGTLGLLAFPYFLVFEFLGPAIQVAGLPATIGAWATGRLSLLFVAAFLVVSLLLGILLSLAALALEEFNFRRHHRGRDLARLVAYAALENFGYRQLNDLWRLAAFGDLARRRTGWGEQRRKGLVRAL